jgi:hypothetical protein
MTLFHAAVIGSIAALSLRLAAAGAEGVRPTSANVLDTLRKGHPRLILTEPRLAELKRLAEKDKLLARAVRDVLARAEKHLKAPALKHELIGPRLLHVSRRCLHRIYTLALAWRWTGKEAYAAKAKKDLLTVCAFPDWNPSHFLDTAEMSHAVGVGYDWLHGFLDEATRREIREGLIRNGLSAGLARYRASAWWTRTAFNWNQVCNGGLLIGALAIAEERPLYARRIVPKAVAALPKALETYEPDGAWGEGPGYWDYATSYTVFALAAMETALGTDFGLSKRKGLSRAGEFPLYMTGPTGMYFCYADAGEHGKRRNLPALLWLSRRYGRPGLAQAEREMIASRGAHALDVIWYVPEAGRKAAPRKLARLFRGPVEVAVFRSAWDDPQALFVAVKAGYNQVNHGHLDLGSFELDALGVRWARDLGRDNYNLPGYWNGGRGGKRWTYYRLNSQSHNVPLIDGKNQDPHGRAEFTAFGGRGGAAFAVLDMTSAYPDSAKRVARGIRLLDSRQVLIQDELRLSRRCEITWGMTTDARINAAGSVAELSLGGKKLQACVLCPQGAALRAVSAEQKPPQKTNRGVRRLVLTLKEARGDVRIAVLLTPLRQGRKKAPPAEIRALKSWGGALEPD